MDTLKIAIYGAGSIGTISGAYLSAAYGKDHVTLIDTWPANVAALNAEGAHVIGTTDFTTPVTAVMADEVVDQFDLILLHTKQVDNAKVIPAVKQLLKPDGTLVSLQNGVPERYVLTHIPAKNLIAGSVVFGATGAGPGVTELTTAYDSFKAHAYQIGEIDGTITQRTELVQTILSHVGMTLISNELMGTKWSKLLVNAAFSGLSTIMNRTFGEVAQDDIGVKSALHILNEGLNVGQADGITFTPLSGVDLAATFGLTGDDFTDTQIATLRLMTGASAKLKASMLQDLYKQRKTEVDYINGLITATARDHGIATPFNDLVVKLITEAERTHTIPTFEVAKAELQQLLDHRAVVS
ncbi:MULTISPECIES: ketopantoate reductase family protein [Lacticaseibacillus]|jgi:2-dehydropantoate 2-reductase|uniref:2-dehydropantoate 2-reductase n=1 Tax=Lacticaseibacillus huelsenbergensis TaxID=3035291 RepID=A0ABY8DS96_9LACO|nr:MULTISPECIES: 2-dehydropantoate 2-reductase [Lacticaseibacillus]MDG3061561.1 2-dehydropantoate 2-reductase [Lacticaseibacillus sp. BCRC 81376]WFB39866.1 2-dehydropantoate 2-reductase [Lacticaseibacillus huelsenbergensis]